MAIEKLITPVGRLVWGNPAKPFPKKDQKTKQPILKDGKQVEQWSFGIAIPKAEFNAKVWPQFYAEAASAYGQNIPPQFSWKFKDGDSVDRQGKPYALREGYAGCIVLNIATEAFAPPIYKLENGQYRQIAPEEIKTGDYIAVSLNVKVNVPTNSQHTPGLYVNPNGIELVGYGKEIHNTANPEDMFGGVQHALPAGASATPISGGNFASAPGMQPAQPMQQQPQYAAPAQPMMQPQPVQQPQYQPPVQAQPAYQPQYQPAGVTPAHDFVNNAGMQPAQPMQQQPQYAAPAQPQYQPAAGGMPSMPQR